METHSICACPGSLNQGLMTSTCFLCPFSSGSPVDMDAMYWSSRSMKPLCSEEAMTPPGPSEPFGLRRGKKVYAEDIEESIPSFFSWLWRSVAMIRRTSQST